MAFCFDLKSTNYFCNIIASYYLSGRDGSGKIYLKPDFLKAGMWIRILARSRTIKSPKFSKHKSLNQDLKNNFLYNLESILVPIPARKKIVG